jgi:hypothetical protein
MGKVCGLSQTKFKEVKGSDEKDVAAGELHGN